ncbi:MAG: aldolase/citrate lyase family protein [Comamonadaceae bacterium]|nr:aldolase/citrate lyase family protein [Comamonadaceae bacterium]
MRCRSTSKTASAPTTSSARARRHLPVARRFAAGRLRRDRAREPPVAAAGARPRSGGRRRRRRDHAAQGAGCVAFVREVAQVLAELEHERGMPAGYTRVVAMIESPDGLANIDAIAAAASARGGDHRRRRGSRVLTLQCAVDDEALLAPNQRAVFAARRAGVMPLGFVGSVADYADLDAFRARIERARRLGFDGGFCVHPRQVPVMNQAFAPTPAEVARAQALVAAFEAQQAQGRAAFAFEGRMVDRPVVEQARALLARAARIAQRGTRSGSGGRPGAGASPALSAAPRRLESHGSAGSRR